MNSMRESKNPYKYGSMFPDVLLFWYIVLILACVKVDLGVLTEGGGRFISLSGFRQMRRIPRRLRLPHIRF